MNSIENVYRAYLSNDYSFGVGQPDNNRCQIIILVNIQKNIQDNSQSLINNNLFRFTINFK